MRGNLKARVLIIGGGAAGLSAAIFLGTKDIILVESPGSNSVLSPWNIMVRPAKELRNNIWQAGNKMNDRKLLEIFSDRSAEIIKDLGALGVKLRKSNIGFVPEGRFPGLVAKKKLNKIIVEKGARILSGKVDRFLVDGDGKVRCVNIRLANSSGVLISFDYLVLAGGGLSSLFEFTTGEKSVNGSILALCHENNFFMRDLEFFMFHPFLLNDKRFPRVLVSGEILSRMEFKTEKGDKFLSKKVEEALRSNKHHSIFPEMVKEFYLQSLRGKIFGHLDCSPAWFERYKAENEFGFIFQKYKKNEIGRLRIRPAFHYSLGGLVVNGKMQTSQSHVYAAGEIVGGLHGSNRIGGTAVNEAWVFGKIAAEEINKKNKAPFAHGSFRSICGGLKNKGRLGISKDLKNKMWLSLGPVKTRKGIEEFLSQLDKKSELTPEEKLVKRIAEISLLRKESVGVFYRNDLPILGRARNSYVINNKIFFK